LHTPAFSTAGLQQKLVPQATWDDLQFRWLGSVAASTAVTILWCRSISGPACGRFGPQQQPLISQPRHHAWTRRHTRSCSVVSSTDITTSICTPRTTEPVRR
ncbi:unnamed protein product, partial [Pylaiella littoralis]